MTVTFWVLAPIAVLAALGMVVARKAVHSALFLASVMICLALLYASLDAPFLFAVQVIVYTGAIIMLFLFVLMLVGVDASDSPVETLRGQRALAILGAIAFGALLLTGIGRVTFAEPVGLAAATSDGNIPALAALLFSRYVFAFEVTSALLITAALGAMILAHRERLTPKLSQKDLARLRFKEYAEKGRHPGQQPPPGTFARHNSIATPALLPDGSVAEGSVSRVLLGRGVVPEPSRLTHTVLGLEQHTGRPRPRVLRGPDEPETTDRSDAGRDENGSASTSRDESTSSPAKGSEG